MLTHRNGVQQTIPLDAHQIREVAVRAKVGTGAVICYLTGMTPKGKPQRMVTVAAVEQALAALGHNHLIRRGAADGAA